MGICVRSLRGVGEVHELPGVYAVWPLVGAVFQGIGFGVVLWEKMGGVTGS